MFKILHRYWQDHADLRDELASHSRMLCLQDAYDLVDQLYQRYERLDDWENLNSSSLGASWYRRHWTANGVTSTTSPRHSQQVEPASLSIEERKALLHKRIAQLKAQKKERKAAARIPS